MNGLLRSPNAEESVAQASSGAEPTMEEILASIRSLIADEGEAAADDESSLASSGPEATLPVEPEPAVVPRVVWSRPEPIAATPPVSSPLPKAIAASEPPRAPRPAPALEAPWPASSSAPEEPLLSTEADEAATSSFDVLNVALRLQSSDIAERMIGEMLRPILKSWLDENLPSIVEKLVRAEIQRVARGHG
jgi:cell pole-organizing protein PopZ